MKNDFFPKLERSLEDFLYEEEGNITRNKMVMVGSLVLVLSLLMYDEVFAGHRSHSSHSSHRSHSSGSGGGHGSHSSHESHTSHVSGVTYGTHSNVATHGSHSNHANHASHSSESHYNNADASTGLHSNTSVITPDELISVADVSGILTPQNNYIAPVEGTLNTAVSIPDEVKN